MSHISKIELEINDLDALKSACNRLGLKFVPDLKQFRWYSGLSECDHAIIASEAQYQIGVVKSLNKYDLFWDRFDSALTSTIGENAGLLKQAYTVERVKAEARKKNYQLIESHQEDGIRLTLTI